MDEMSDLCMEVTINDEAHNGEALYVQLNYVGNSMSLLEGVVQGRSDSAVTVSIHDAMAEVMIRVGADQLYMFAYNLNTDEVEDDSLPDDGSITFEDAPVPPNTENLRDVVSNLASRALPSQGFKMNVHVFVDAPFKTQFGNQVNDRINAIFSFVNTLFKHPSLGTVIEPTIVKIEELDGTYTATGSNLK